MFDNVFENRGKWQKWSGAQSLVPDCPGRRFCRNQLQLLNRNDHSALVATESWRRYCLLVYTEPRDEEERKNTSHNKHKGTSQLSVHHSLPAQRLCRLPLCCGDTVLHSHPEPVPKLSSSKASFALAIVFLNLSVFLIGQMMSDLKNFFKCNVFPPLNHF